MEICKTQRKSKKFLLYSLYSFTVNLKMVKALVPGQSCLPQGVEKPVGRMALAPVTSPLPPLPHSNPIYNSFDVNLPHLVPHPRKKSCHKWRRSYHSPEGPPYSQQEADGSQNSPPAHSSVCGVSCGSHTRLAG